MSSANTAASGGELSLSHLLATLTVVLNPETYVFATLPTSSFNTNDFSIPLADILLFFREPCTASSSQDPSSDQITLILRQNLATSDDVPSTYPCRMITCNIHSSLSAVGFMAVLARRLTDAGVSVNPVSGYFHDHLFVPVEMAELAVEVLEGIARGAREGERSG